VAPALADTAPLPDVQEAEVSHDEPKKMEITQEELDAKAAKAKEEYHKEEPKETAKTEPEKPKEPAAGNMVAKGVVTYATKANVGGYRAFAIEGYQKDDGKDIMFSTKDEADIKKLLAYIDSGKPASVEYKEVVNGEYVNFNIVSVA
jgi:hypothetical protein